MAKATPKAIEAARTMYARLRELHPDAHCELNHTNAFELLVSVVLSAQTNDKTVNQDTPALFAKYPNARALAKADPADVEKLVARLGFFRVKSKAIISLAKSLVEKHDGEVPQTMEELTALSGVGRKTANVVMGTVFGNAVGVVVDTHVQRLSQRLGFTKEKEPEKIEHKLMQLFPQPDYALLSHTLIFHGRRICFAQKPACAGCGVNDICPVAFKAEKVGRKPKRERPTVVKIIAAAPKQRGTKLPKKVVLLPKKAAKAKTK